MPEMTTVQPDIEYEEDWLPTDFQPLSFRQLLWKKIKGAPLVGVGGAVTMFSLLMASYQMRIGNSTKFNYWLRWRVGAQTATIGAAIYYGGVAFTRSQQEVYARKQSVLLGELPSTTPIPKVEAGSGWFGGSAPTPSAATVLPDGWREAIGAPPDPAVQARAKPVVLEEDHPAYGLPVEQRVRLGRGSGSVSGSGDKAFEARMKMAERAQSKEDAARERRENSLGTSEEEKSGIVGAREFLEARRGGRKVESAGRESQS